MAGIQVTVRVSNLSHAVLVAYLMNLLLYESKIGCALRTIHLTISLYTIYTILN